MAAGPTGGAGAGPGEPFSAVVPRQDEHGQLSSPDPRPSVPV